MVVDFDALAQRVADAVVERIAQQLPAIVREEIAVDSIMDTVALARYLNITRSALSQRLRRASSLASISTYLDGKQVWRKSDVDALLIRQPKLRAVGNGQ